jgi:zinc protease
MKTTRGLKATVLVIGLTIVGASGSHSAETPKPPIERKLASGLEIAVLPIPGSGLVHVELRSAAGLTSQPRGEEGVAQVTAELLRHGTTTRDVETFTRELDRTGGELIASVGRDFATLGGTFFARDVANVFELMSDAVRFPRFDEERMRGVLRGVSRQLAIQEQSASSLADAQVLRTLFLDHAYGMPVAGRPEALTQLTRDQVVAFHAERWSLSNSVLVVVGDVQVAPVMAAAETWFGSSSSGGQPAPSKIPVGPPPSARIVVIDRATERAEIRIAWLAPARATSEEASMLMANALYGGAPARRPGGERQRFGRDLRTGYLNLRDAGVFTVAASAPVASASEAVNLLIQDVAALRRVVPGSDLDQARRMLSQSIPLQHETLAQAAAAWLAADFYGQPADVVAHYRSLFTGVTADAIGEAAARWLDPERAVIVVVGPAASLESPLRHFGTVEVLRTGEPAPTTRKVAEPSAEDQKRGRDLVAKALRAHGGAQRLSKVRDTRIDSDITMTVGNERLEGTMTQVRRDPFQMVLVTEVGGIASRQTLNGRKGWRLSSGDSAAIELDSVAVIGLRAGFTADLPHLLLAGQDAKVRVYAAGAEPWGEVDAPAVVVEAPGEPPRILYFHPESGGLLGFDQGEITGAVMRRRFSDLRTVADILWPHHEERQLEGETMMTVRVRTVQVNVKPSDSMFQKP